MKIKKVGIRTQIFLGFSAFTLIIVCLLWVFQIGFLNNFYRAIKYNEVKTNANLIIENLESDNLVTILQDIAINDGSDILITNSEGYFMVNVSNKYTNSFQTLTSATAKEIFEQTKFYDGEYIQWNFNYSYTEEEELLYLRIATTSDGEERLIILNTTVTPVSSTVETLKVQLIFISFSMLILSTILAMLLSFKISKPITQINETAKLLASGDYDIEFKLKGSKEVVELSETLNYASVELSKVESLRRELIANVSHDLRTPLTMISGYGEVMRDIPGENSPENIQIIIDEAERLKNLVNDLLDISKLEAGQIKLELAETNITQVILNILSRYDKLVDYNFDFYYGDDVYVMGDEIKLSQVVYNLVNNAINYTGQDKKVILKQIVEDDYVKIEVIDTGDGIEEDKIQDIWERYYKGEKSHKMAQVGTGLGLSIVKNIVDLHQGQYGAESVLGQGSSFWFKIPIYNDDELN